MVNRRQFGIWTASVLFLGPAIAAAGEPQVQQAAEPQARHPRKKALAPADLDALSFAVTADPRKPGERLVLQLSATNPTKSGMVVVAHSVLPTLENGGETTEVMGWMNDDFPYSRRVMAPSFVDLAPESTTLAGRINVEIPEDAAPDTVVRITVRISDGQGKDRVVELPPMPLNPDAVKS